MNKIGLIIALICAAAQIIGKDLQNLTPDEKYNELMKQLESLKDGRSENMLLDKINIYDLENYQGNHLAGINPAPLSKLGLNGFIDYGAEYEQEPNNSLAEANSTKFGNYIKGYLDYYGDNDWFRFTAPAGAICVVEAYARRLLPMSWTDPYVYIYDDNGNLLGANDDRGGLWPYTWDSRLQVMLPVTGTYYLRIRDFGWLGNFGPDFYYVVYVGYWGPNRVQGEVFHDVNNNGVRDEGEPGLAEKVVYAELPWVIPESLGKLMKAETDEAGRFVFNGLYPGLYTFSVEDKEGVLGKAAVSGLPCYTTPRHLAINTDGETYDLPLGLGTAEPEREGPSAPPGLVFVSGTPTAKREGWDNCVDGDLDGWDGTTTARGEGDDPAGPAWGIFEFADGGIHEFNQIWIQTGNGIPKYANRLTRQAELWVSEGGTAEGDFRLACSMRIAGPEMQEFRLEEVVRARYVKLVLLEPTNAYGGWRQVTELKLDYWFHSDKSWWPAKRNVGGVPMGLELNQNYPNPFNPVTTISFSLPEDDHVRLEVVDMNGRVVDVLLDGEYTAGNYSQVWDGSDRPSGVYYYRLTAGRQVLTKKMLLLK